MMKKWRPFWSYDVEKTEHWLAWSAAEGKRLVGVKRLSRMFLFEDAEAEEVDYQIMYDKSRGKLPRALDDSGWKNSLAEGSWKFVKNGEPLIQRFPSREGILKLNRTHSSVLSCISLLYGFQLIFFVFSMLGSLIFPENSEIVPSPFWAITILYFLQVIAVLVLTFNMTRKLRAFERKFFSNSVDAGVPAGKTVAKWKFGWMYAPDLIENWLSDMAADGYHLVRVGKPGTRFVFEKGTPKLVSYVYDFQLKASPNYYDIHKSAGWQLKFRSPYSITKYSIWQKEYQIGEEKPRFTYDSAEKKAQVRKVLWMSTSLAVYMLALLLVNLWINVLSYQANNIGLFQQILIVALIVTLFIPVYIVIRTFLYAKRMRKA